MFAIVCCLLLLFLFIYTGNTKRSEVARQKIAAKARQEAADTIEKVLF